ncbi:MAG: hypothetical protein U0263_24630 [Polyangiaceae bacterium]
MGSSSSRRRVWPKAAITVLVLVLAGVGVGFGPLVRAKASAQAARRGLTVEIDAVRPGMGKIGSKACA